ncbi:hypothetical protein DFH09DRAFT_1367812 [Mycena vulgaris]|nr:hypothetical protein DFH09DRAFT_1367812 [Mycena vulgaris]
MSALDARLDALDCRLDSIQREVALNGNMEKGTGYKHPYAEVLFVDGSRPSVAVPALPALLNVDAIRNLTEAEAAQYLLGFGLAPIETFIDRKNRIAEHVGCLVDLCPTIGLPRYFCQRHIILRKQMLSARQIALQAPPLPGPAAATAHADPLGGVAPILDAIAALENRFNHRLDGFERRLAIASNMYRGTVYKVPYTEVLFVDGSTPSVLVSARAALPPLVNVDSIRNLTGPQAAQYLVGFGIAPIQAVPARQRRIARHFSHKTQADLLSLVYRTEFEQIQGWFREVGGK